MIRIYVNEECLQVERGVTAGMLRRRHHPSADLLIVDGFPVEESFVPGEGARVVFIRKGAVPTREELERLMVARHSPEVFGRMKAGVVGIAGVGGLGSAVAVALARTGVGRLILADGDVVEPSNLNRQHYFVDQLGRPKVEALRETLARINPFTTVETHAVYLDADSAPRIFREASVVVEALDRAEAKVMLIDALLAALPGVEVVAASGLAGYETANDIRTTSLAERLTLVGDTVSGAAPGQGLMAPRVGVAAHHQANAVVRILMGLPPAGEGDVPC